MSQRHVFVGVCGPFQLFERDKASVVSWDVLLFLILSPSLSGDLHGKSPKPPPCEVQKS